MTSSVLKGERLEALLSRLPRKPGVYIMKGNEDKVLYVGKAKNLRARVRSYFRKSGDYRPFVKLLDKLLFNIEFVVTPTEKDALVLEREFISRYQPTYNIDLRDDKSFLSILISGDKPFPRLSLVRSRPSGKEKNPGKWFGPYTSARAARKTIRVIQQVFGLRTCSNRVFMNRQRPCLLFQIHRCLGPCKGEVNAEQYAENVAKAMDLLRGKAKPLLEELHTQMDKASHLMQYEQAASYRDKIKAVRSTVNMGKILMQSLQDADAIGLYREGSSGMLQLLQVRSGRWHGAAQIPFSRTQAPDDDLLRQFVLQHYSPGSYLPSLLLLPESAGTDQDLLPLAGLLFDRFGQGVKVSVPRRGVKWDMVRMACEGAKESFRVRLATSSTLNNRLERLQSRLGLSRIPRRIECFDMSTSLGKSSVGAMAVMLDGEPVPSEYRRYRIRFAAPDSDVDMMREVLSRRFRPVVDGTEEGPDLVVADGGRGQLNAVLAQLNDLGLDDLDVVSIAKGGQGAGRHKADNDRVFIPGRKNPVRLRYGSDELFLLSRVRDEAHRTAISYHRRLNRKAGVRSVLDDIKGVGPVIRKRLLHEFGGLAGLKNASIQDLGGVKGVSAPLAKSIFEKLRALDSN